MTTPDDRAERKAADELAALSQEMGLYDGHVRDEQLAAARAAVAQTRAERGIDPYHDSGADSGSMSEDEERERADRPR